MWQDEVPLPTARAWILLMLAFISSVALLVFFQWLGIGERFGVPSNREDAMYYSGFLVILPALIASLSVEKRFQEMFIQIREDGVISATPIWWEKKYYEVRATCRRWQVGGSMIVGLAVLFTFDYAVFPGVTGYIQVCLIQGNPCDLGPRYLSVLDSLPWSFGLFVLVSLAFGILVGQRLGTMAGISRIVGALFVKETTVRLQPKHDDQIGGFSRMGSLIALQGTLAAAPLVFLTVWLVLISFGVEQQLEDSTTLNFDRYANWFAGFLIQSIAALLFVATCFLLPFARIQRIFKSEREKTKNEFRSTNLEELTEIERTEHISNQEALRNLPSSPVAPGLKLTFTISNAAPYFLLAASMLLPDWLRKIVEAISGAFLG